MYPLLDPTRFVVFITVPPPVSAPPPPAAMWPLAER